MVQHDPSDAKSSVAAWPAMSQDCNVFAIKSKPTNHNLLLFMLQTQMIPTGMTKLYARLAVLFFVFSLAVTPFRASAAGLSYLAPGHPDALQLLAPPPLPGSAEQDADMQEVRAVNASATMDQKAAAMAEKKFSVFNFAAPVGDFFKAAKLPKTEAFFKRVQTDAASVVDGVKDVYMRPRPYFIDPSLANGKLETSYSYPSGHSTETMTLGLVLAEVFPEKRDAILAHARLMGWHRVQIARHYPTDIYAGRVLAQAIVREMNENPQFQHDLAEVKAEVAAAQQ
jgi:acid phosphatase (class A)